MGIDNTAQLFQRDAHNPSFESIRSTLPKDYCPIDFCVPVNRHFPPAQLLTDIQHDLPDIVKYCSSYADAHQAVLAEFIDQPADSILIANDSTELITLLCSQCNGPFATSIPTFGRWTDLPQDFPISTRFLERNEADMFTLSVQQIVAHVRQEKIRTLVLSNPNNPTGAVMSLESINELVTTLADLELIIIDESFLDFCEIQSAADLVHSHRNLVIVKSLGKSIGWHGIRLGYAVTNRDRVKECRPHLPYWNINGLAAYVLHRFPSMRTEFLQSLECVRKDRDYLLQRLRSVPHLCVFPSAANFVFVKLPDEVSGQSLRDRLLINHRLLIRECSNKLGSTEKYLRLAVNMPAETDQLVRALTLELSGMR